jgi:hypothetical protein
MVVKGDVYCNRNRITYEIKSKIGGKIIMGDGQQMIYDRRIKMRRIRENINLKQLKNEN